MQVLSIQVTSTLGLVLRLHLRKRTQHANNITHGHIVYDGLCHNNVQLSVLLSIMFTLIVRHDFSLPVTSTDKPLSCSKLLLNESSYGLLLRKV